MDIEKREKVVNLFPQYLNCLQNGPAADSEKDKTPHGSSST